MSPSQHQFVANQYGPRANDYVTSLVHSVGADLDQLEELLLGRADARVLDLGCGGGHVAYRAAAHVAEVVAYDLTPDMLEAVKQTASARGLSNIAVRQGAAEALPFEDDSFDFVLCRFSAHHWQDLDAGLREACRVLKPDGLAAFVDTVAPAEPVLDTHMQAIELLRDQSHVRNYSVSEWVAAASRAGFAVTGITARRLPLEFASWVARTRTEAAYVTAIRALQESAPSAIRAHFDVGADGSFTLDSMTLLLTSVRTTRP